MGKTLKESKDENNELIIDLTASRPSEQSKLALQVRRHEFHSILSLPLTCKKKPNSFMDRGQLKNDCLPACGNLLKSLFTGGRGGRVKKGLKKL